MGVPPMKMLTVILAALFTLASAGQAFAFDRAHETNAQVYFAIPFGGTSKADATPRFGFSVDYGTQVTDSITGASQFRPINSVDFHLDIAGDTSIYGNGVNLGERLNALYASDDDFNESYMIPLGIIGAGFALFLAAKSVN